MDAQEAINGGYTGSGESPIQSVVNFLRDWADDAPCHLERETLLLAKAIEDGRWDRADEEISQIIRIVRGVSLTEKGETWAIWIGMAQKTIERRGVRVQ